MLYEVNMPRNLHNDEFSVSEVREREQKILRGAFAGSPTPLKDIPKASGEPRSKLKSASDANAKTASQDKKSPA